MKVCMLCPLCQKECIVFNNLGPMFRCPTEVNDLLNHTTNSHFSTHIGRWEISTIPPFKIITVDLSDPEPRSTIYKNMGDIYYDIDNIPIPCYTELLVLPKVHLDLEDKLLERIKLILLLS